jgi:hypothetical protein
VSAKQGEIRRNPRVVYRALAADQGGVLLHLDTGAYHGLNALGAKIWQLIDAGATPTELAAGLRIVLDDQPPDIEGDLENFLASLHQRDLIVG